MGRLTANQVFDCFAQRNIKQRLLEFLCNESADNIHGLDRLIGNLGCWTGTGGRRRGGGGGGGSGGSRRSTSRSCGSRGSGLWLVLYRINIVIDLLCVFVVAKNLSLYRFGGIIGFVLGGEGTLSHDTQSVGRADLDHALSRPLGEEDILCFNPSDRRCKLVGEKLDEQGVGEFLFDFGTHFERQVENRRSNAESEMC